MEKFQKALNYSFLLLKYRARTKFEIISRLRRKGYGLALSKKVVAHLKENNYLDDEDFTSLFIAGALEQGWGPRRIDFKLKQLGIGSKLRQSGLVGLNYGKKIQELIKKRIKGKHSWSKIIRFLAARGFDHRDISQEMAKFKENNGNC